jgi:hypothetical protein
MDDNPEKYFAEEGWCVDMTTGPLKPSITDRVISVIRQREIKGWQTYGRALTAHDGRDTLQDAIEEAADLLQYLVKLREERANTK